MNANATAATALETRVLLFVSTRKDAEISQRLLAEHGLASFTCNSLPELVHEIGVGAAAVLATDELAQASCVDQILSVLERQEAWSDLPFVLLLRGGAQSAQGAEVLQRLANVIILERPSGIRSVMSAVHSAVRARRRQYETRNYIRAIRHAEAKARQAAQAKDDFLAALSHELRTPLTPVLLLATEAATDSHHPQRTREIFESIAKNVALEARLIDDLLDLTHITRGKFRLEKADHDALAILRDALANVEPDLLRKGIRVVQPIENARAPVSCDPTRLQQVFWNILRNAAKFTPPGGTVTLAARWLEAPPRIQIQISDTGIGMLPDELERVFDAFVQGHHAHSVSPHQFGGLGLGLAISHRIVSLHDGRITAESDGLGKGSAFTVELPLAAEDTTHPHPPVESEPSGEAQPPVSMRILLVEDDPPSRVALARLLSTRDHHVRSAESVADACRVADEPFDLLISDIGLPDGSGYDLLEQLRPARDFIAIALTGYGMEDDVQKSRNAGFFTHLTKPVRAAEIDRVLRMAAEKLAASKPA